MDSDDGAAQERMYRWMYGIQMRWSRQAHRRGKWSILAHINDRRAYSVDLHSVLYT